MTSRNDHSKAAQVADRDVPSGGERFERRRGNIIAAAIPVLNEHGFKGMRLTVVAEVIGLRATGVTYYFPRKEELAVACLESGFAIFDDLLGRAEGEAGAAGRIGRLIELFVAREAAVRAGEAIPLCSFAPIRSLEGEHRASVDVGYMRIFRRVRALLDAPELDHLDKTSRTIRTHVLLEQLYWASTWLGNYDLDHFPRIARRMTDIVNNGLRASDHPIEASMELPLGGGPAGSAQDHFLVAATRQINEHGYRGASVDRISAALNVTKGAFYHHNEAKDDLVAACFRRSFAIAREAQRKAHAQEGSELRRLVTAAEGLIRFQLGPEGPLLRTSALSSMPQPHRLEIMSESYRVSRQFGAMISDGIADGSMRAVDPAVAGAMLHAAINVVSDMRALSISRESDIVGRIVEVQFCGLADR